MKRAKERERERGDRKWQKIKQIIIYQEDLEDQIIFFFYEIQQKDLNSF